jgi:hypothetical protein
VIYSNSIEFDRRSSYDEYDGYQDLDYANQWQNQYQRSGTPNEFETDRRPSPLYNNTVLPQTRTGVPITNDYQQNQIYRDQIRQQPPVVSHARVSPIHAAHPAAVPVVVREHFYRPQYPPSQFPEYANGYQAQFPATAYVGHTPVQQHMTPHVRRHDDSLRNLRSPLLEEFRGSKTKKYELKVSFLLCDLTIRIFSDISSSLVVINMVPDSFSRNWKLLLVRKNKLFLMKLHLIPFNS